MLLVKDSEGLSVLTAWAAGKFGGDDVGLFVKKCGIMDKVKHKELIIRDTRPPSPGMWKKNCPVGPLQWDPEKPLICRRSLKQENNNQRRGGFCRSRRFSVNPKSVKGQEHGKHDSIW